MNLNKNAVKAIAYLGFAGGIVLAEGLHYCEVVRVERKKRKKIEAWHQENLECIARSHERLNEILNTEPFDNVAFWTTWKEEQRFLNIVQNQPMY